MVKYCGFCGELADGKKFCSGCGSQLDKNNDLPPDLPSSPSKSRPAELHSQCPKCGLNDAVQKVASIVDAGTTSTVGNHFGLTGQFGSTQQGYYGGSSAYLSQSNLSARFQVPIPEAKFRKVFFVFGILISAFYIFRWLTDDVYNSGTWILGVVSIVYGVLPGLLLGWAAGTGYKDTENKKMRPMVQQALEARDFVRNSFYCHRDDIVFSGEKKGSPEEFVSQAISRSL